MIQDTTDFVKTLCCQRNLVGEAGISQTGLVGGLEHDFYDFPYIGNFIIPTDELIFFRGLGQPPNRGI